MPGNLTPPDNLTLLAWGLIIGGLGVLLFLALRAFALWYWKINRIVDLLEELVLLQSEALLEPDDEPAPFAGGRASQAPVGPLQLEDR